MTFSAKTMRLLTTMAKKDDDAWFAAHEDEYNEHVRTPFVDLVMRLGEELGAAHPRCRFSARSVTRVKGQDGSYKDYIACMMSPRKASRFEYPPGFYVSVGPGHIILGAGVYRPSSPQLRAIRTAIQRDPEALTRILREPKLKRLLGGLGEPDMTRGPRGFEVAPKYQALLMHKSYTVARHFTPEELANGKRFETEVVKAAQAASPFVRWLEQAL